MKHKTQALHLEKMMQKHTCYLMYELTLPLVTVRSNKLKKLSVDDVLILGFDRLEFLLIEGDTIYANMQFNSMENRYGAEVVCLSKETIKEPESKKYKTLKISFGTVQSRRLKLGATIDITHVDLERVTLVSDGQTVAEGSLVNVDEKIAIEIKRVYI